MTAQVIDFKKEKDKRNNKEDLEGFDKIAEANRKNEERLKRMRKEYNKKTKRQYQLKGE